MKKRVVVGLSGGVDSSVAAFLLTQQGYDVIAIFMRNWHDESVIIDAECPWIEDSNDALAVAEKLGIPFQVLDLSKEYKERIVDYMFAEYKAGRTPNPDILCNREIKFDVFLKHAIQLGADYVATGHYCQKAELGEGDAKIYRLLAGADATKDQSYFLCNVSQEQLSKALFPIGHLQKSRVREIAKEQGLLTADKKDSQGLCFIGKVKLPVFLQQKLEAKKGRIIELDGDHTLFKTEHDSSVFSPALAEPKVFEPAIGVEVGQHQGAHFFTIGQRRGVNVGGRPLPSFVLGTDVEENIVYTGQGENHPGLYRNALQMRNEDVHWVRTDLSLQNGESMKVSTRIRYRQPLSDAVLYRIDDHHYLHFAIPQRGVAPGQFAAWYHGAELIGSGVIQK